MTDLNVPAVASAAFLGFLALAALLFCVPPVTRFLGDLFCCPWRVPFTRKRRRNDDEEVDKEDLPYLAEPRPSTPDDTGYRSMPNDYMSVGRDLPHSCLCSGINMSRPRLPASLRLLEGNSKMSHHG